jgi:uncharacterized protein (TIGR02145 family)
MAVLIQSNNFSGQIGDVILYAPTGHTIPYNSASGTSINLGEQIIPISYQNDNTAMEYGVFSLYFSGYNKTCETSQITPPDGDGNVYRTIKIGNQVWMAENLRTTKFQDGSPISYATNNGSWSSSASTTPLYTFVNNNSGNTQIHGLLYNYQAVRFSTSSNTTTNICPVGWRVPVNSDFSFPPPFPLQISYPGNEYWDAEDIGSGFRNNQYGFNAIGSGGFNGSSWDNFRTRATYRTTNNPTLSFFITNAPITGSIGLVNANNGETVRCIKN